MSGKYSPSSVLVTTVILVINTALPQRPSSIPQLVELLRPRRGADYGDETAVAGFVAHQGDGGVSDAELVLAAGAGAGDARSLVIKRRNAAITAGCGWRMFGTD